MNRRSLCTCGARLTERHTRDAGDLGPTEAADLGYCPDLAAKRTRTQARLEVAEDAYIAAGDPRTDADDYAAALARALAEVPS